MKRLALKYLTYIALGTAAMGIVAMGWALHSFDVQARGPSRWVRHTLEVIRTIDQINEQVGRAESAQLAYLLSGRSADLFERDQALAGAAKAARSVRLLTSDRAEQQLRALHLDELIVARDSAMREVVGRRSSERTGIATAYVSAGVGQRASAQVYALTGEMQQEELRLLAVRRADERPPVVPAVTAFTAALLMGLVLLGFVAFVVQVRTRDRAELKLADMVESLPGAVYKCRSGPGDISRPRFEFVSQSVGRLYGMDREALLRSPATFWEYVLEDDRPAVVAALETAAGSLEPLLVDFRIRPAQGEPRWMRSCASLRREPDGSLLWNGYWADITAQKELEEALHEAEAAKYTARTQGQYRGLLEAAPEAMVVVDEKGGIVLLNVQAEKQFGYHRDELLGKPVKNIIPDGFAERLIADRSRSATEALAQHIATGIELSGLRKDGSRFPIEIMLSPLESAEGILVTASIRDLSARRTAERLLEQMENRYRGLMEAAPDAMVVVNQAGQIVFLNVQAETQFGYRRDELVAQQVRNIIPEGFAERLIADGTRSPAEALAQQVGAGLELSGRRKDGTRFPIEIMLSRLESTEGILITVAIRDLTVLKDAERQKGAAEDANRAKSVFLATMSHEVRTPMNGVLGMLELLSLTNLDPAQLTMLEVVRESGTTLQRIIDDILDLSKIEAGKLEVRPEAASIQAAVEAVRNIYSGNASSKGLLLESRVDPRIGLAYMFDPMRLRQILNNLVSNALKFTTDGQISIEAELVERSPGRDRIRFSVKDTGAGISTQNQTNLFQPFVQATDSASPRTGGTGLGLTICQRLAVIMGGTIQMVSQVGEGTSMSLELSLASADPKEVAPPDSIHNGEWLSTLARTRRRAPTLAQAETEGTLVLLVDDHPTNRSILARQVNMLGFASECAENGAEALEKWKSRRFGMVITDCNMPEMNGYELTRFIRGLEGAAGGRRIPIVACTANVLGGEAEACFAAGMDAYLPKPVQLMELAKKLDQWLPVSDPPAPLDRTVLGAISGGDEAAELELLAEFRRVNDVDAAMLEAAVSAHDRKHVTRAAHRMKGAARTVGADALATACERLERASRANDRNAVETNMEAFHRELNRLNAYCEDVVCASPT